MAANSFHPLLSLFILLMIASTLNTSTTLSTVAKDLVPCTMCVECENPCKLPPPPPVVIECPPPPPPVVIECPPPPVVIERPPPPSLPPPPPPVAIQSPPPPLLLTPPPRPPQRPPRPPPRPPCPPGKNCERPPRPPNAVGYYYSPYFPTGTPRNYDYIYNKCGKLVPFSAMLVYVAFLCLPYYLFII